jgi:hypothetical protein
MSTAAGDTNRRIAGIDGARNEWIVYRGYGRVEEFTDASSGRFDSRPCRKVFVRE